MNYLTNSNGDEYGPRLPLVTDNLEGNRTISTSETVTYNGKAAASAVTINPLQYHPIMSAQGDRVASYWGNSDNLVYTAENGVVVVETAGSATVACTDPDRNLELAFESLTTTVKRFVAKVTDSSGGVLYGWVMGVAAATNLYTFSVYSTRVAETNDWVGALGSFDQTKGCKLEIFRYDSSVSFGTGTTLTEEVRCPYEYSPNWKKYLDYASVSLSAGQWFCDYMRGLIIGKRADATASETVTYNIQANAEISVSTSGTTGSLIDDAAFGVATSSVTPAGFLADETSPDSVDEGDVGAARMTLNRRVHVTTWGDVPTTFTNFGANATLNVKASAGNVFSLSCNNENAADMYVQLHNTVTVPAGGGVPIFTFRVPAGGDVLIGTDFFTTAGAAFATGIAFAFSTTKETYTAGTATDHTTQILYK